METKTVVIEMERDLAIDLIYLLGGVLQVNEYHGFMKEPEFDTLDQAIHALAAGAGITITMRYQVYLDHEGVGRAQLTTQREQDLKLHRAQRRIGLALMGVVRADSKESALAIARAKREELLEQGTWPPDGAGVTRDE